MPGQWVYMPADNTAVDNKAADMHSADKQVVGKQVADRPAVDKLFAEKQVELLQVLEQEPVPERVRVRGPEWKPAEQRAGRNSSKKTRHQLFENRMIRKTSLTPPAVNLFLILSQIIKLFLYIRGCIDYREIAFSSSAMPCKQAAITIRAKSWQKRA